MDGLYGWAVWMCCIKKITLAILNIHGLSIKVQLVDVKVLNFTTEESRSLISPAQKKRLAYIVLGTSTV